MENYKLCVAHSMNSTVIGWCHTFCCYVIASVMRHNVCIIKMSHRSLAISSVSKSKSNTSILLAILDGVTDFYDFQFLIFSTQFFRFLLEFELFWNFKKWPYFDLDLTFVLDQLVLPNKIRRRITGPIRRVLSTDRLMLKLQIPTRLF